MEEEEIPAPSLSASRAGITRLGPTKPANPSPTVPPGLPSLSLSLSFSLSLSPPPQSLNRRSLSPGKEPPYGNTGYGTYLAANWGAGLAGPPTYGPRRGGGHGDDGDRRPSPLPPVPDEARDELARQLEATEAGRRRRRDRREDRLGRAARTRRGAATAAAAAASDEGEEEAGTSASDHSDVDGDDAERRASAAARRRSGAARNARGTQAQRGTTQEDAVRAFLEASDPTAIASAPRWVQPPPPPRATPRRTPSPLPPDLQPGHAWPPPPGAGPPFVPPPAPSALPLSLPLQYLAMGDLTGYALYRGYADDVYTSGAAARRAPVPPGAAVAPAPAGPPEAGAPPPPPPAPAPQRGGVAPRETAASVLDRFAARRLAREAGGVVKVTMEVTRAAA